MHRKSTTSAKGGFRFSPNTLGKVTAALLGMTVGVSANALTKGASHSTIAVSVAGVALIAVISWLRRTAPTQLSQWMPRLLLVAAGVFVIPAAITPAPWGPAAAITSSLLAVCAVHISIGRHDTYDFYKMLLPFAAGFMFTTGGIDLLEAGKESFGIAFIGFGIAFIGVGVAASKYTPLALGLGFTCLGMATVGLGLVLLHSGHHIAAIVAISLGGLTLIVSAGCVAFILIIRRANASLAQLRISTEQSGGNQSTKEELVIFVHGTFAGDRSGRDEGERWWQRGSKTWSWFQEHLPTGIVLPDESMHLFHWSGNNSQTERFAASTKLLAQLIHLEREGRRYHLVGHSHGGSIIWEALVSSVEIRARPRVPLPDELREELGIKSLKSHFRYPLPRLSFTPSEVYEWLKLPGLQTWTTIGTPFLHHLPRKKFLIRGWPDSKFSILGSGRELLGRLLLVVIVIVAAYLLGVDALTLVGELISNKVKLPGVIAFVIFLIALLGYRRRVILRNLTEALIERERTACYAFLFFSERWLGIWSPLDEAIASLKASAPRMACDYTWLCSSPRTRAPYPVPKDLSDILSGRKLPLRLSQPRGSVHLIPDHSIPSIRRFLRPIYYCYNRWLAPRVGLVIARVLLRSAQGNDIPGSFLAYVNPWPVPIRKAMGGLPRETSRSLEAIANADAEKLGRRFANFLPTLPLMTPISSARQSLHKLYSTHRTLNIQTF